MLNKYENVFHGPVFYLTICAVHDNMLYTSPACASTTEKENRLIHNQLFPVSSPVQLYSLNISSVFPVFIQQLNVTPTLRFCILLSNDSKGV